VCPQLPSPELKFDHGCSSLTTDGLVVKLEHPWSNLRFGGQT
jgi:hypothetical protein